MSHNADDNLERRKTRATRGSNPLDEDVRNSRISAYILIIGIIVGVAILIFALVWLTNPKH
jgi:hypothetical protein